MIAGVDAVYVVIGCDVDPDRAGLLAGTPRDGLAWRGMSEGLPAVKEAVRDVKDSAGREPVFTWFLRADEQIRRVHGDAAWSVRAHDALLKSLRHSGDELAWHPHFWRRDDGSGRWFQEVEDEAWQVEMLRGAHQALLGSLTGAPWSVRMGWSYHTNRTMAALDDLRVAVDCSAIPGYRTFRDRPPTRGENLYDWHSTPRRPFRPSRSDYRRPPAPGEQAFRVLEVPSFVSGSLPWALLSSVQLARKTGDPAQLWYAVRRPTYCVNVTARPRLFAPLVSQLRASLGGGGPLVVSTQCHADELVPNRSALYSLDSVKANLEALVHTCHEAQAQVKFVQARELVAVWPDPSPPPHEPGSGVIAAIRP